MFAYAFIGFSVDLEAKTVCEYACPYLCQLYNPASGGCSGSPSNYPACNDSVRQRYPQEVTPSCPNNFSLTEINGKGYCVFGVDVIYSCPQGGTLYGDRCYKCPTGFWMTGGKCVSNSSITDITISDAFSNCPQGSQILGTKCVVTPGCPNYDYGIGIYYLKEK